MPLLGPDRDWSKPRPLPEPTAKKLDRQMLELLREY